MSDHLRATLVEGWETMLVYIVGRLLWRRGKRFVTDATEAVDTLYDRYNRASGARVDSGALLGTRGFPGF